ncbi:MAG: hypothetical protein R6U88_00515, partial [Candidatus Bipolaricaulota bacterium]
MGKAFLAVLFAGLVAFGVAAQDEGFGLGGVMMGMVRLDLTELNAVLDRANYPELRREMLVIGGGGGGGVTRGAAFGGIGFSGTTDAIEGQRRASLTFSFGGMTMERVGRLEERALLGIGGVIGGGTLELTVRSRYADDLQDAITDPTTAHLNRGFFGGMVHLRLQLQLLEWMSLEGWAGYIV